MLQNETKKKIYLNVKDGQIVKHEDRSTYTSIGGSIEDIAQRERTFNGEALKFWYLDIKDGKDIYSLSFPYSSGVFKSIVNCLASAKSLDLITIKTYLKDGFSKVVVFDHEQKLEWKYKDEIPPLNTVNVGGKEIKDDTRRMQFFEDIVAGIKGRLSDFPLTPHVEEKNGTIRIK